MKLAQAGFGDFLADTRVRKLKRKHEDNKEVCLLIKYLTVPDINKLMVNIKL